MFAIANVQGKLVPFCPKSVCEIWRQLSTFTLYSMRGTEILYHYRYIHFTVNKTYLLKYHCTLTLSNTCNSIRMSPIKIKLLQKIYKTTVKIWKFVSNTPQTYMVLTLRRWKRLVNSMEPWDISSPSRLLTKSQAFHIISLKWSTGSRRSGVNSQFKVKFS